MSDVAIDLNEKIEALRGEIVRFLDLNEVSFTQGYEVPLVGSSKTIDIYCPKEGVGILFIAWRRLLPTSKLVHVETLLRAAGLRGMVIICQGLSYNAANYLARHQPPINVMRVDQIEGEAALHTHKLIGGF